jgi:hypothetical protein
MSLEGSNHRTDEFGGKLASDRRVWREVSIGQSLEGNKHRTEESGGKLASDRRVWREVSIGQSLEGNKHRTEEFGGKLDSGMPTLNRNIVQYFLKGTQQSRISRESCISEKHG